MIDAFTLHLGDCLDPTTGLASLADKSVDAFIGDPPYAVSNIGMWHVGRPGKGKRRFDFFAGDKRATPDVDIYGRGVKSANHDREKSNGS